jgi:hypothetical protein
MRRENVPGFPRLRSDPSSISSILRIRFTDDILKNTKTLMTAHRVRIVEHIHGLGDGSARVKGNIHPRVECLDEMMEYIFSRIGSEISERL